MRAAMLVFEDVLMKMGALSMPEPQTPYLRKSLIYRVVQTLVEFAQGSPVQMSLDVLLAGLTPIYRSARHPLTFALDVEAAEPHDELGLAVMGAMARHRLIKGHPLSCCELAILMGRNKDHVTALAAAGEIPGAYRDETISKHKPWRFRVSEALKDLIDNA